MLSIFALVVLFIVCVAAGVYALIARKASAAVVPVSVAAESEDFAALSEAQRCDVIFAMGDLEGERSRTLLIAALDDPSPTVALAAAHVLARNGCLKDLEGYARSHEGARTAELLQMVSLLT
ncbi:MAG: hypothetical protein DLM50_00225 [Candidatus Meridianibacter frigidus]|nr:MAG: hypothetical protein DLM50_00225 [Candidatus Eremiobacteraeota bacterium]